MTLRLLDLFSGIGGFSYAAEKIVGGFRTTQFVELDPYCQKVLCKHWPQVAIHADIRTFTAEPGMFDVITAGFPCQDLSAAGKQRGLQAERSGLFYEVIRLARELRPQFVLFENVGNLLSHQNGSTFQEVLFQIAKAGFDAEWAVIPASDVGACHQRKRVWILAYADSAGLQRQWRESQLQEIGGQEAVSWRSCGELPRNWKGFVSEPILCRGDDGLSGRMDRLKALGNSIVPQVAAVPLQRIKELSHNLTLL